MADATREHFGGVSFGGVRRLVSSKLTPPHYSVSVLEPLNLPLVVNVLEPPPHGVGVLKPANTFLLRPLNYTCPPLTESVFKDRFLLLQHQ